MLHRTIYIFVCFQIHKEMLFMVELNSPAQSLKHQHHPRGLNLNTKCEPECIVQHQCWLMPLFLNGRKSLQQFQHLSESNVTLSSTVWEACSYTTVLSLYCMHETLSKYFVCVSCCFMILKIYTNICHTTATRCTPRDGSVTAAHGRYTCCRQQLFHLWCFVAVQVSVLSEPYVT